MTEYVILQGSNNDGWHACGQVSARSVRAAIKLAIDQEIAQPPASIVAVPRRSFQPATVTVETKTALKFS